MNQKFTRMYKNLCSKLGENNDALYGVLTIAASKGILRPTFTMMDKKQEKKSRQYTAFREALTGIVAFGAYIVTHKGVEKLVKPFCKKSENYRERRGCQKNPLAYNSKPDCIICNTFYMQQNYKTPDGYCYRQFKTKQAQPC